MLITCRPEFSMTWGNLSHVISMPLGRLSQYEAAELVERIAGMDGLPLNAKYRIVSRADGIPLFVEELARSLIEMKSLDQGSGSLEDVDGNIPSTLHDLLSARLDRLGLAKKVLQVGAAIGREFSQELVSMVFHIKPQALDHARHRTVRTKGALSAKTAKLMVFKLVNAAAKTWRRLKGENQLPKVVQGVKFQNGIEVIKMPAHHTA
jgi:predicted ATPase